MEILIYVLHFLVGVVAVLFVPYVMYVAAHRISGRCVIKSWQVDSATSVLLVVLAIMAYIYLPEGKALMLPVLLMAVMGALHVWFAIPGFKGRKESAHSR